MGYTETSLQEHVTSEHAETSTEVVSILLALRTFLTSDVFVTNKVTYHIVFASQEGAWSPEHFHRPLAYFIVLSVDAEVVFFFFFLLSLQFILHLLMSTALQSAKMTPQNAQAGGIYGLRVLWTVV